jgi:anti-sigma factor RsiW
VTCDELRKLLPLHADGELDTLRSVEVERHLADCPACAAAHARSESLRTALADPSLYHPAPSGLREQLRTALREQAQPRRRLVTRMRWPVGIAAAVTLAALTAWGTIRALSAPSAEELLAKEVTSNHARSLMAEHLFDFASTNQHRVKPWFSDKVHFAPDVRDFEAEGFPLEGSRVEDIDGGRAAALVYKRREHIINLFEWPAGAGAESPPRSLTQRGFHLIHWRAGGLNYWAVSDLNEGELAEFVGMMRR